jgi:hypothetical protein
MRTAYLGAMTVVIGAAIVGPLAMTVVIDRAIWRQRR